MVFQMCRAVAQAFVRQAVLAGVAPGITARDLLDPATRGTYLTPAWNPPAWTWADPYKDTQAEIMEVEAGFALRSDKVAARGQDPDEFDRRRKAEMTREAKLGVSYGEDGAAALPQPQADPEEDPPSTQRQEGEE
mgnify:FL=1